MFIQLASSKKKIILYSKYSVCRTLTSNLEVLCDTSMHHTKLALLGEWDTFSNPVNINKFDSFLHIGIYQLFQTD